MIHRILILFSIVYPLVRYNGFGGVPCSMIPTYIFNKSLCIYATGALLLHAWHRKKERTAESALWFHRMLPTTGLHVLISATLMSPAYFKKLFSDGILTWTAEIAMLAGFLAALGYWKSYCNSTCLCASPFRLKEGTLLVAVHLAFIGFKGWITPSGWPGGMPPITLFCFAATLGATALLWQSKESSG